MIEQELIQIIKDLRAENSALLEIILKKQGLIEEESKIEIPESMKAIGRVPWYKLKDKLERETRKPKLSEIAGIPGDANETEI